MTWLKQNWIKFRYYGIRLVQILIILGFSLGIIGETNSDYFNTGRAFFSLAVVALIGWWYKNTKKP